MIDTQGMGPGHKLGKYELLVPVAQGGMATIWAARLRGPRGFSKLVAIKAMLQSLSDDPQFEQMFLAEAKLTARIRHPGVCEIFDLGEQDGVLYIAMEWIDGEPLGPIQRAAAKRGGVPLGFACRIGAAAAMGLHAAHELTDDIGQPVGLVHRDVSPSNILVKYDGEVKVIDFGIAKASAKNVETPRTRVGQIKGTLTYMSPEQAGSGYVDRRSDIFSLGVVLYQLISGVHPFKAENEYLTLGRILAPVPALPLAAVNGRCPRTLSAVIMKAMEKRPENRWATMAELAQALDAAAAEALVSEAAASLGAFVRDLVGVRADRRVQAIREAERLIQERAALGPAAPPGPVPSPQLRLTMPSINTMTNSATLASAATATAANGAAVTTVETMPPPRRTQKTALLVAGGLILAVAGTVGAVRTLGGGNAAEGQPAPTTEAPRPAASAATAASATSSATAQATTTSTDPAPAASSAAPQAAPSTPPASEVRSPGGQATATAKPKGTGAPAGNLPRLTDPGF